MAKQKGNPTPSPNKKAATSTSKVIFQNALQWWHIAGFTLLYLLICYWIYNPDYTDLNGDNFAYYLLGKGLAEGKGYVNATAVIPSPQIHFPPGFPFIIAIFIQLFGTGMDGVATGMTVFYFISLVLFYLAMNRIQPSKALSFVVTVFLVLNNLLIGSAMSCMSEIPFVLTSAAGIFFLTKSNDDTSKFRWSIILTAVFFAMGYYIKTIGIGLFGALFLYLLFSKKWKDLIVSTLAYLALVMPWIIRGKMVGSSYASQLMQVNPYKPELGNLTIPTFIERVQNNFVRYISLDIPNSLFDLQKTTEQTPMLFWIVGLLIIVVILWGIFKLNDFKLFFLAYIGSVFTILLVWPDAFGGLRFIEVLVPVFMFLFIFGIVQLLEFVFVKINLGFSPYWLLLFGFYFISPLEKLKTAYTQPLPPNYRNYFELAKWAKQNTPKDAVFSARKPDMFMYYADRITVGDKPSLNDTVVLDFFKENGVDYVVLEQLGFASTSQYLYPAIQKNQDKFPIASQLPNPDTYLLKFAEGDR